MLNNPPIPLFSSNPRRQPTEENVVDPREIDKVLSEVAAMIGRWHLFKKFLLEALKVLDYPSCFYLVYWYHLRQEDTTEVDTTENVTLPIASRVAPSKETDIIASTASQTLFEQLVVTYYIPLETWYTRTSIDKVKTNLLIYFS